MPRLFQITEDDLADLEKMLPEIGESLMPNLDNRLRVKLRRCQTVLSSVRWNYGPPTNVKNIVADDDQTL